MLSIFLVTSFHSYVMVLMLMQLKDDRWTSTHQLTQVTQPTQLLPTNVDQLSTFIIVNHITWSIGSSYCLEGGQNIANVYVQTG